jgi:hypothetical protein
VLELSCRLVRADNQEPVPGRPVHLYMNQTYEGTGYTDEQGYMSFNVTIYEPATYFFRLQFYWPDAWDILYQDSNNVTFAIIAQVQPVFIQLTAEPTELKPGKTLTLTAKILNATSNMPLQGFEVFFYWLADDDSSGLIGTDITNAEGVVTVQWTYPNDGKAYVFYAYVSEAQKLAANPVQLTVGRKTSLTLNVEQGENYEFTIYGKLGSENVGVADKQIIIKVNGTAVAVAETSHDGSFTVTLTLKPENNQPTSYQVEAIYYGDNVLNFTLYQAMPDGTKSPLFITLHYFGYKPAAATTWLTVEPQATHTLTPTKTPEQLQAEAEQSGWLSTWHEFTWWPPWYRLHVKVEIGPHMVHMALNPLLPGGEIQEWTQNIPEFIIEAAKDVISSYLAGEIAFLIARYFGSPFLYLCFFLANNAWKSLIFATQWNSPSGLKAIIVSSFISAFLIARGAASKLMGALSHLISWFGELCSVFDEMAHFAFNLATAILDIADLILNLVFLGLSIWRLSSIE